MKVLALCSYPKQAAATRFRIDQFVEPMRDRGIDITVSPFLDSRAFQSIYEGGSLAKKVLGMAGGLLKRVTETFTILQYDLIFVQREAMLLGPAFFEWFYQLFGRIPMVLDLDDATYVRYVSPTYGRIGSFFKFFGKTDYLIKRSAAVVCGNRFIAEHVTSVGGKPKIIPTIVDTDIFKPAEKDNPIPVIGWIGTHSTAPFLSLIFPVLERLGENYVFKLKVVGAGPIQTAAKNFQVEYLAWDMDREVEDFQSIDIGIYPIMLSKSANEQWLLGKSGFKAIQYLAVGVPFVMSPVGACADIGISGTTHFNAVNDEEWYTSLKKLLDSADLRRQMGNDARQFSLENYGLNLHLLRLAEVFERAVTDLRR
jgi:glycosyltransferase involved in cell wall biosynthesis